MDYIHETDNGTFVKRGKVWTTLTQPGDPAYQLMQNPNIYSVPNDSIYRDDCYICVDPEFAMMGLPLCKPCPQCGGHCPADDVECENGHDLYELYMIEQDKNVDID